MAPCFLQPATWTSLFICQADCRLWARFRYSILVPEAEEPFDARGYSWLIVGHATMRCQSAAPSDKNQCNCKCVRRASVAQKRKGTRLTGAINLGRPQKSQMSRGDWCPHRVPYRGQVSGSSGECTRNGHWNGSWPRSISIKLIATARRSRLIHSPHLFLEGM